MYEKGNVIKLILLTAAFALLFINIFQPFNSREWYPNISEFKYFFFSSLIILTGMLVVVISRLIMLRYTRKKELYVWQYSIYVLAEVTSMSLFIQFLQSFFLEQVLSVRFLRSFCNRQKIQRGCCCCHILYFGFISHG